METSLPICRRASQHPRRANRSPRGTRPSCTLTARPCAARQKAATTPLTNHKKNPQPRFNRNQQYSITGVRDGGGAVVERYAYSAYGQVTIADASGSVISDSAIANRYTYAGREWDEGLSLYHYRARTYDAVGGRFVSRDPIGFVGSPHLLYEFIDASPLQFTDPTGLKKNDCHANFKTCIEAAADEAAKCRESWPDWVCEDAASARMGICATWRAICIMKEVGKRRFCPVILIIIPPGYGLEPGHHGNNFT
jgi:RHS repeat-associated protein